jgi:AcrR family transcriptional regulator
LTLKAILQAAAQVLVAHGYESTTTEAIAHRAGVSIGTLYQYFPNKESIVGSLVNQHVDEILATMESALVQYADASVEIALRAIIHASIEAHRINPALHKVLSEQVPRKKDLRHAFDVMSKLQSMLEEFVRRRIPSLSRSRIRMIAFIMEGSVEALTHRAVLEAPEWLRSGELELEATRLLTSYLRVAIASP